ncbi:DUF1801 domain-containing protein [Methylocapsa sp. S129]|uniref:DUF1801 domain-containing protein n=1 Tax=Methylocapsa sp. S129 TaxID=1641869 RepID=UPI00131A6D00|nr:DUF1801 domain-containing protein [Methylocapsa sp. S129]
MLERAFENAEVEVVFHAYPGALRENLLFLRELIFETALATEGVGELEEVLKWGQPSYVTAQTGSGSTIRIDQVKSTPARYAMYFHCQTNLIATFREFYPKEFRFGGNRSILFDCGDQISDQALRHCVALALTYHLKKSAKPPAVKSI